MNTTTHPRTRARIAAVMTGFAVMIIAAGCGEDASVAPADIGTQIRASSTPADDHPCMGSPKYDDPSCGQSSPAHSYGDDRRWIGHAQ